MLRPRSRSRWESKRRTSFAPSGLSIFNERVPRVAPWTAFFHRFAAALEVEGEVMTDARTTANADVMADAETNEEIIERLEADSLPGEFHHADHVRLAYAYLSEYPVLQALDRFGGALKRFAAARGKSTLYHETVTHAYFFVIRERMARCEGLSWQEFAERNPDLFVWKGGVLSRYYKEETLRSDLARQVFVFPDRFA
jgi:hypothetical protein